MNLFCENCGALHDGSFASGRFCTRKCAFSFSTKHKRKEINEKVSSKLKGRPGNGYGWKKGFDSRRRKFSTEDQIKTKERKVRIKEEELLKQYDDIKIFAYRLIKIKNEQDNKCGLCKLDKWLDKTLVLELHHVDGTHNNINRDNLIYLCPNCHSQTPNWRGRGKIKQL